MSNTDDTTRQDDIARIAKDMLRMETLEVDADDPHEYMNIPVALIRPLLEAAHDAGRDAERKRRTPTKCDCPACGRRIDIFPLT